MVERKRRKDGWKESGMMEVIAGEDVVVERKDHGKRMRTIEKKRGRKMKRRTESKRAVLKNMK